MKFLLMIPLVLVLVGCGQPLTYEETYKMVKTCEVYNMDFKVVTNLNDKVVNVICMNDDGTNWHMYQLEYYDKIMQVNP